MTLAELQVKWSVILMDHLGPGIFSALWKKGHVLHRARAHLKVPGWSLVCWMHTLLTKKIPIPCFCRVWMKLMEVAKRFYQQYRDYFEISLSLFLEWWILLCDCDGKMGGWMEFYPYFPSVTFVVLTADQFVGRDDGRPAGTTEDG